MSVSKSVAMTMSREEKMIFRKQQDELKEMKAQREQAEKKARLLSQQQEHMRKEAIEAKAVKNRELTPWCSLNLCEIDDNLSDEGEVIFVADNPFPLRTITTSYPEARSKTKIADGCLTNFRLEVLRKGNGPWSIGIVVDKSILPGEYWCSGKERANLVWYMNTRHGNTYCGDRLLYRRDTDNSCRFYGPSGWEQGHEYSLNSVKGFSVTDGDTLYISVDLQSELGTISFAKNDIGLPNRLHPILLANRRACRTARLLTAPRPSAGSSVFEAACCRPGCRSPQRSCAWPYNSPMSATGPVLP